MHAVHEVLYLLVFLLPGGLPEMVHSGFGFWRRGAVPLGLLIGCLMSHRIGGEWVVAMIKGPVAGVQCPRVVRSWVNPALPGTLQRVGSETSRLILCVVPFRA